MFDHLKWCVICLVLLGLQGCLQSCGGSKQSQEDSVESDGCLGHNTPKAKVDNYQVKIYLETSQSMFGFMRPKEKTRFQSEIWDVISSLNSEDPGAVHLYQTATQSQAPRPLEFVSFRKQLNSGSFQPGSQTDIPQMLDSILHRQDGKTVSMLISDLIFSPGDHSPALLDQITADIRSRFYKKQWASVLIQLSSEFYFRSKPGFQPASPYYIWLIGKPNMVMDVTEKIKQNLKGYQLVSHGLPAVQAPYSILPYSTIHPSAVAYPCEKDKNYYSFTGWDESETPIDVKLAVNLHDLPPAYQDTFYIKKNLVLDCPGGKAKLVSIDTRLQSSNPTDQQLAASIGATHFIRIKVNGLSREDNTVVIDIKKSPQSWVGDISQDNEDPDRQRTTGLNKMVTGLDLAYPRNSQLLANPLKILITTRNN